MRKFKLHAEDKKAYFALDGICYIMMHSISGCTLQITSSSTKIRAHLEPEKVKEFNKAMTTTEMNQEEKEKRKREQYVLSLEEKYDDMREEFLRNQEVPKDIKKVNRKIAAVYAAAKEIKIETGKNRRELLCKVAAIYKKEKDDFYGKYRYFQSNKWKFLRAVKQNMLEEKIFKMQKKKRMAEWVVWAKSRYYV